MNAPEWVHVLPHVNAALNGAACVLLCMGLAFILNGKIQAHRRSMLSAFVASSAFLVCYLVYHQALHHYTGSGSRGFPGTGLFRRVYLTILISHTVLAAFVPVLALRMMYLAAKQRWSSHKRLGKVAFPIWVYVSATGVIIYVILYHLPIGLGG